MGAPCGVDGGAVGWRRPGHGVGGVDGGSVGWRRRGVRGARDRWGRLGWRRRGVTGVEAPRGGCSQGWAVGSLEAPWDGGAVRWVESGIGGVDGGAMGWRRRGVGPGGWSKGWVGSSCPAEQGPAPPPAAARPLCPPQVLPKGYVMPVLLQLGPSRLLPGRSAVHPRACWARAPALGPGPLGASTCWHQHSGFNRRRGSTSSFTLLLFQANY
jgi:hypothetical protein